MENSVSRKTAKCFYIVNIFLIFVLIVSASVADDLAPIECLYDSVFINIKDNYTAEIVCKLQYRFNKPGHTNYSSIKVPVNRHVKFSLLELTYIMSDSHIINLGSDDIETISGIGHGYYSDSKTKIIHLPSTTPGASAIIAYRLKYQSLLYLPQFLRQKDIPIGNSYIRISSELPYEYFVSEDGFVITKNESGVIINADKIPAYVSEANMPPVVAYRVVIRPDTIRYEGNKFGLQSWSDVAAFYNYLAEDGMIPDDTLKNLAARLCRLSKSRQDTLQTLLDFVRDNIRYVSIDIGRGEFKPLPAKDVYKKKYGDCKDQSELLIALLRSLNFKANPALIATRNKPEVITALPWPGYFNHVITAVDTSGGHLFLDASQSTCCFGHLPSDLRNRRALICGREPYLDFTLTSAYNRGNKLIFNLNYKINSGEYFVCDVDFKLFNDAAYVFYSNIPGQVLNNVIGTFLGDDYAIESNQNFVINHQAPDRLEISGQFYGRLPEATRRNHLLVNTKSPFISYLKRYFNTAKRAAPYTFDFTFSVEETVSLELADNFEVDGDSLTLAFNERGLNSDLSVVSSGKKCRINKNFHIYDYTLSPERYNRFFDFLLIASQIPYNSIEIVPEK